jgi:hypothetical protein
MTATGRRHLGCLYEFGNRVQIGPTLFLGWRTERAAFGTRETWPVVLDRHIKTGVGFDAAQVPNR